MLINVVSKLFKLLNYIFPKVKNRSCFIGYPDYDDMLRGIQNKIEGELVVLINSNKKVRPIWLLDNIKVLDKRSLLGLYYLLTSRTVFYTHGIFSFFSIIDERKQIVINLWHGMPIKNVGHLDDNEKIQEFHRVLATSEFYAGIMSEVFQVSKRNIIISGLPRNEVLINNSDNFHILSVKNKYDKFFVWLPTYRKSVEGDIRVDSKSDNLLGSDDYDLEVINSFLKRNNAYMYIKPHPMAKFFVPDCDFSNIEVIDEGWLIQQSTTLYELLSESSALITDYSSVVFDYMVTKKKIILTNNDIKDYKGNRGFIFSPDELGLPTVSCSHDIINNLLKDDGSVEYKFPNKYISHVDFDCKSLKGAVWSQMY